MISRTVDLDCPDRFTPDSPLGDSKNYLDLKRAATDLPEGRHFILIEGVADFIAETLFLQDERVARVEVRIVKQIGRASCRERVCQYGVDLGGRRIIKKKKRKKKKK